MRIPMGIFTWISYTVVISQFCIGCLGVAAGRSFTPKWNFELQARHVAGD